ncbi:MAG: hypothetical protein HKN70_07545, partial [Gammaproteobacteria bacterium]|nr:hypothetical protein [Gammaproteobacteria bacterium]
MLTGHRSAPLISALAVGVRSNLDASYWDVLIKTGTAHLMAISGLHIGLAGMLGFGAGRYLPVRITPGVNLVERGRVSALVCALVYAALAGFAISTVRALVMLLIWYVLRRGRLSSSAWTALLLTVASLLLLNLRAAAGPGLWLSAGAVAIIIAASGTATAISGPVAAVRLACRVQIMLMLLLVPLAAEIAGGISWIAGPINVVLVPVFSFVVVPGVLLGLLLWLPAPELSGVVLKALATFLDGVWHVLEIVAAREFGFIALHTASGWSALL